MTRPARFETILVPHDFSPTADRALELAKALARAAGPAKIVLVHAHFVPLEIGALAVRGIDRVYAEIEKEALTRLGQTVAALESEGFAADFVALEGAAENVVLKAVEERKPDLIIMGTHARRGLGQVFLGSIAERVLRLSPCPVIAVPPEPESS